MNKLPNKRVLQRELKRLEASKKAIDETFGEKYHTLENAISHIKGVLMTLDVLERHNLLGLTKEANEIWYGSKYEDFSVSSYLSFDWADRTKARHIYGGVFPEEWQRRTYVQADKLVQELKIETDKVSIAIKFTRPAILGEKVNGCTVKAASDYTYDYEPRRYNYFDRNHLTLVCPTRR